MSSEKKETTIDAFFKKMMDATIEQLKMLHQIKKQEQIHATKIQTYENSAELLNQHIANLRITINEKRNNLDKEKKIQDSLLHKMKQQHEKIKQNKIHIQEMTRKNENLQKEIDELQQSNEKITAENTEYKNEMNKLSDIADSMNKSLEHANQVKDMAMKNLHRFEKMFISREKFAQDYVKSQSLKRRRLEEE